MYIKITKSPITIPVLPTNFFRYVRGVRHDSWLSYLQFIFWPLESKKNSIFGSLWVCFPFPFFLTLSLAVWDVCDMFHGFRINGLRFDPPNKKKNSIFKSLLVEKAVFMHIFITRSPISIPFVPTTFVRCVGCVRLVSWLSDLRFAFWPPKPQKLSFWKPISWKSCFHAYLDDRESNSNFVSSYNFLSMCGRYTSFFIAIESTVCVLTPQTPKT